MQFAIPQFTEVEDRLIGPLTLKQFLVMLGTGGIILFFWSFLGPSIIFFLVAVPIGLFGLAVSMGKYNGRPLFIYLMPFVAFASSTKVMVFKRETAVTTVSRSKPEMKVEEKAEEDLEPAESRLKKLAYLMDRKTLEQGEILSSDQRRDIIVPQAPKIDLTSAFTRAAGGIRDQIRQTARHLDAPRPAARPVAAPTQSPTRARLDDTAPAETKPAPKPKKFDPSSFLQI